MSAEAPTTPAFLHEVLGERARPAEVVAVVAFGAAVAFAVLRTLEVPQALPTWRWVVAALLIGDIAAGALANFTSSTNDFYAARPRHRWVFIAVHVHPLALAAALGLPLGPAAAVWLPTVASAAVVNALAGMPSQRFVAALLLGSLWVLTALLRGPGPLLAVEGLFALKVAYAFAVDHGTAPRNRQGTGVLGHRDRADFAVLAAESFAEDPLFQALLGHLPPQERTRARQAWMRAVFDMNRLVGGTAVGTFDAGRLVGAMLLEPPPGPLAPLRLLLVGVRFLPVLARLPAGSTAALNAYGRDTRRAVPVEPHHYLVLLAVAPSHQGRGLGRALVDDAIARARAHPTSRAVALDTELPANVPRYEAWGFVRGTPWTLELPGGAVGVTPLHRPVRGSEAR